MQQSFSASNESLSRVLIRSAEQTTEHSLPLSIIPSSPLTSTTRRTSETQTTHESKSTPSFADTQLLSVYYLDPNASEVPSTDRCTFVEQQNRQPVRFRQTYDPLAAAKSTQTLTIQTNERPTPSSSHEHSEEYTVYVDEKPNRTSSSSSTSSSVTTVIEQSQELNRSSFSAHQRISSWPPVPDESLLEEPQDQNSSTRVHFAEQLVRVIPVSTTNSLTARSISPPAVARRTQISTEQTSLTGVDPQLVREQLQRLDYYPKNQSNWIRSRVDHSDAPIKVTSNRVNALKTLFEQSTGQSSTSTTQSRKVESEERLPKYGDEIRFYAKNSNPSTVHHAELVKVIEKPTTSSANPTTPSYLDQIRQITGKSIQTVDDLGHYLQDGQTWQWNEVFWLGLTTSQRDQLKDLELNRVHPSSNGAKHYKSTVNIVGAGAWLQNKSLPSSASNITRYSEVNSIDESQSSSSVISCAPTSTYVRIDSQESIIQQQVLTSTKRSDSQITMIESGYNSADEQQRLRRPHSGTIIEESPSHRTVKKEEPIKVPKLDPLSYEQFICDYFSRHAQHVRANDGTLLLSIDGQQIPMSHIHLPSSSNETLTLANSVYIDAIDKYLSPFETESEQLIVFLNGEAISLDAEHWLSYREKYSKAPWVRQLKRINRDIPEQFIPIIEQWLAEHATLSCETHELHVNGLTIPLLGRLALHLLDSYSIRQLQGSNYWNDVLRYLLRLGYISYEPSANILRIGHSELDVQRLLASTHFETQIEMLIQWLNRISEEDLITITEQNDIVLFPNDREQQILIDHEHIHSYMEQKGQQNASEVISMNDIAHILLRHDYVQYSSGQLTYSIRDTTADSEKDRPSDHQTVYEETNSHLIDYYVEFVNDHQGIHYDNDRNLLLLENPLDHSQLYLTPEHTDFIRQKGYRKEDMKTILNDSGHIEHDEFHNSFLSYNNQRIPIPLKGTDAVDQDNLTLLFPFDESLRLIEKTSSTTTLDIEQPCLMNNYSIDPLLILANYIHRAATIYQDERARLVIKLHRHEIVIPQMQAIHSIQAINASPQRTGTIIARLVQRLGRVQYTQEGGLIITIGRKFFELSKAVLESSTKLDSKSVPRRTTPSPKLPLLRHSKSASSLSSASVDRLPSFNDDQQMLYTKDGRADARYVNLSYANSLENLRLSSCGTPRLIIIPDDQEVSSSKNTTRFYIQYTYEDDSTSVPHLMTPKSYQDESLRSARVYVRRQNERELCYENLADYLSTEQSELSSRIIRRMLKFSSSGEYFTYLSRQMSTSDAQRFVEESEERSSSPGRSPHTLATPEKNITLPRSTSGQSNDGESESRATVSRSASAAAKVATSKSDTMKSTTSSSAASSRESPTVSSSSVVRTQSLVSPNRTNGSKGGGDEVKKEKKSKFRTPSFLRKRKEKKEAAHKDKAEK